MQLDTLLIEAREPEPYDDGFTDRVMASVRSDTPIWWRRRRFLTRPTALAAAALLVAGGALAAVQTVTDRPGAEVPEQTTQTTDLAEGAAPSEAEELVAPVGPQASAEAIADGPISKQNGSTEWGFDNEHAAYVIDHETGLRLDTESYTNTFTRAEPHRVTLTLTNTGEEPLGISSSSGCVLAVAAFPDEDQDSAAFARADDGSWECASPAETDATKRVDRGSKFVLAPGESLSADTELVLEASGDWVVVGMCRCTVVSPEDEETRDPDEDPVDDLPDIDFGALDPGTLGSGDAPDEDELGSSTQLTDPTRSGERSARMITPPIRIQVTD